MTRINTIDVTLLTDQHLMAEYRELPMVHGSLKRTLRSKAGLNPKRIPPKYTLNSGHVLFFYNKGKWLFDRYNQLIAELRRRDYDIDPSSREVDWNVFTDNNLYGDWTPDDTCHEINVERIIERINSKPNWYRYNKSIIDETYLDELINNTLESSII